MKSFQLQGVSRTELTYVVEGRPKDEETKRRVSKAVRLVKSLWPRDRKRVYIKWRLRFYGQKVRIEFTVLERIGGALVSDQ